MYLPSQQPYEGSSIRLIFYFIFGSFCFLIFFETESCLVQAGLELNCVAQAGLKLAVDTPVSASQMLGL